MHKKAALCASLFALFLFAIFVVNQTAQLVALANTFDPRAGRVVLWALLAVYAAAIAAPVVTWFRLPRAIPLPVSQDGPEYEAYRERIFERMKRNPLLPNGTPSIEAGFAALNEQAEAVIKKTAAGLFVTTAISQNGRLDALLVLVAQSRMIWRVAGIYNQRPSLREMVQLYANVAATVFAASELDDLDIAHQVEPVITAAIGSSVFGMIPGVSTVASIATQALLEGTANAYLTLRVGAVCQSYCGSLAAFDRKQARRSASLKAAQMLGGIVSASAGGVVKAILDAAKKAGISTVDSATSRLKDFGAKLIS